MLYACESTTTRSPPTLREPGTYEVFGKTYRILPDSLGYLEIGIASWYGKKFHGRLTANGETYDMYNLTAAHKSLPLPTAVKVTNLDNGKSVQLRVNDRGPFHDDRVIDLSYAAAIQLGFANQGTAPVVVEAIDALNYPKLAQQESASSYYLQIGAFSEPDSAGALLNLISALLVEYDYDFPVRILESEIATGILHKVWIGPIRDLQTEHDLAAVIESAKLGTPIKVQVD
ncbi:MAG: septal ring lytic transglycosylase RlpA family protein [Pseudomonadales bacterium]|nr:septal ring lytic transglycosylase RlpA family protein [Pseudomonadales bacterium]